MSLGDLLRRKREQLVQEWLARIVETYSAHTAHFLVNEGDPLRNPVGHALKQGLPILLDAVAGTLDVARAGPGLEDIVRIRAVQDFTPSQAISFVFLLKPIVRSAAGKQPADGLAADDLQALEDRVDRLALLAFDLFVNCREKIFAIQAEEAKRSVHVLKRAHPEFGSPDPDPRATTHRDSGKRD